MRRRVALPKQTPSTTADRDRRRHRARPQHRSRAGRIQVRSDDDERVRRTLDDVRSDRMQQRRHRLRVVVTRNTARARIARDLQQHRRRISPTSTSKSWNRSLVSIAAASRKCVTDGEPRASSRETPTKRIPAPVAPAIASAAERARVASPSRRAVQRVLDRRRSPISVRQSVDERRRRGRKPPTQTP